MLASARSLRVVLLVLLTALAACALPRRAEARGPGPAVRYRVELPAPHRQYVHVTMQVDRPGRATTIAMPAWTPGSYLVRDHARHVYDVEAEARDGRPLPVTRLDKQTWQVDHEGRDFTVRYRVFAAEPSVRTSHVDDRHASLVGTSVFMYVVGQLDRPAEVDVALPPGWSAHTALPSRTGAPAGEAWLAAADYDALVDGPIELGTPRVARFEVRGVPYEYVLTGAEDTAIDLDRLADDAKRVVQAQAELMGGLPNARYVFLLRVSAHGGGGLEHADSTSMMMRRAAFDDDSGYAAAARLAAHEHFHLWNVKRIHDRALGPFDYTRENHSRLLWFHEGFTETMEALSLLHAGLVTPADHVRGLGSRYTEYLRKPGRNHDPIAELSFDAWIKAYQPSPNHANVAISYYDKGDLIGVALDLELRHRAAEHGREGSLPGLFRRLMASHGASGRGIVHDDIVAAASAEAGEDMAWFFARFVEGTEELPLPDLVGRLGVDVQRRVPWRKEDGALVEPLTRSLRRQRLHTGLTLDGHATVRSVDPDSPADAAGLMLDDEIVAVDRVRADSREAVLARLADHEPGESVELQLFREGRLEERTLVLAESPYQELRFELRPAAELPAPLAERRAAWLGPG